MFLCIKIYILGIEIAFNKHPAETERARERGIKK